MLSLYINPITFNKNNIILGKESIEWKKQVATVSKKKGFTHIDYLNQKYAEKIGGKNGSVLFAHFDYIKIDEKETTIYLMYSPNPNIKATELYFNLQIPASSEVEIVDESHDIETTDEKISIQGEVYGFCIDNESYYFKNIDISQYIEYVQRNNEQDLENSTNNEGEDKVDNINSDNENNVNDEDEDDDEDDDEDEDEDEDEDDNELEGDDDELDDDDDDDDDDGEDDDDDDELDDDDDLNCKKSIGTKFINSDENKGVIRKETILKGNKVGEVIEIEDDYIDDVEDLEAEDPEIADLEAEDPEAEDPEAEDPDEEEDIIGEGCEEDIVGDIGDVEPEVIKVSSQKKIKNSKPTKNLKLSNTNVDLSIIFNILIEESKINIMLEADLHVTRRHNIQILKTLKLPLKIIQMIEKGIYNYAIDKCNLRMLIPLWENIEFVEIYVSKAKHIYTNLNNKSYVKNTSLIKKVKNGDIAPYDLAFLETYKLFPEMWIDIIDEKTKAEKMIKESMNECSTDLFECERCHERKTIVTLFQTRSMDESETKFINCINCGNKWKID